MLNKLIGLLIFSLVLTLSVTPHIDNVTSDKHQWYKYKESNYAVNDGDIKNENLIFKKNFDGFYSVTTINVDGKIVRVYLYKPLNNSRYFKWNNKRDIL